MKNKISIYLFLMKVKYILATLFFISLFIQIINILEVARMVESKNLDFIKIVYLSFLKLPNTMMEILPFVIVISTAFMYRYLITHNELIAIRNIGYSIIDIFKPIGVAIFLIGILFLFLINPLSSIFEKKFELENAKKIDNLYSIKIKNDEIWIKNQNEEIDNFIKFTKIDLKKKKLKEIKIIEIKNDQYKFYLADKGYLGEKILNLEEVKVFDVNKENYNNFKKLSIDVNFNHKDIIDTVSNYKHIPFYKYNKHLNSLKKFNLYSPEVAFFYICEIFKPLFLISISFLVMGYASRFKRNENFFKILFISISIGFVFLIYKEVLAAITVLEYISFWLAYVIMIFTCIIIGLYQSINIELN